MIRVGVSGWRYPEWRGLFYPKGLPQRRELEHASSVFSSVEINGSFYSLCSPDAVKRWFAETPDDFVFSLKGSRYITHMKQLADVETPLANFFGSGILALEQKLGPILWQLPPRMRFDPEKLSRFFDLLPRTTRKAARLAKKHDERVAGYDTAVNEDRPLRYALEVRHTSFERAPPLLRDHDIALCVADTAGLYPQLFDVTSDFMYVRLHGAEKMYASGYDDRAIAQWSKRTRAWAKTRDVYVYFDNDAGGHAPFDAQRLMVALGQKGMPKSM